MYLYGLSQAPLAMHRRRFPFSAPPMSEKEREAKRKTKELEMKIIAVVLVVIGSVLFGIGMSMRTKQNAFITIETEVIKGNKGKSATIGAATGAAVGAGAGATVGGIGIVACGTGVGIPVGVVCLVAAGLCALIGGGVGMAVGTPDETITKPITQMVNAYSAVEYWTVLIAGALLMGIGVFLFLRAKRKERNII